MTDPVPVLSIIVTIVDGGQVLADFLAATARFKDAPPLEIIVPFDASVGGIDALALRYPSVRFLPLRPVATAHPLTSEGGRHELYDRRRAAGLAIAQGAIVAILEDRGQPTPDWAATAVRLHGSMTAGAIGGAIDRAEPAGALDWALYMVDYGRYGRPFVTGPRDWVSDINVSYKREAIEATRALWQDRYQEPLIHWFLINRGDPLILSNELTVTYCRPPARLATLIPEKFHWGRLFGHIRAQSMPPLKRVAFALASPLVPPVLWLRQGRLQAQKGRGRRYLAVLPYVMVLTIALTVGEVAGVVTRRP